MRYTVTIVSSDTGDVLCSYPNIMAKDLDELGWVLRLNRIGEISLIIDIQFTPLPTIDYIKISIPVESVINDKQEIPK